METRRCSGAASVAGPAAGDAAVPDGSRADPPSPPERGGREPTGRVHRRWRERYGPEESGALRPPRLARPARTVARDLLGARLLSTVGGTSTEVVIVETEAYLGTDDPASHAATSRGLTERNRAMFGPAGRAYVYLIYGVHWCANVVTGEEGTGEAVLLRGAEPLAGRQAMERRRAGRRPLLAGPGRLCQALAIDGALYGHPLDQPPLRLRSGWTVPDEDVAVTGRIGVTSAADRPFRFVVRGSPGVSVPVPEA